MRLCLVAATASAIFLSGCVAQFPREPTSRNSFAFSAEPAEVTGDWAARKSGGFDETQLICDGRLFVRGRTVALEPGLRVLTVSYWGNRGQTFMFYRSPRQTARVELRPGGRYVLKGQFEDRHVQMSLVALPEQRVVVQFPRVELQEHKSGGFGRAPAPCDPVTPSLVGTSPLTAEVRRAFGIAQSAEAAIVLMNPTAEDRLADHRFFIDGQLAGPVRPGQYLAVPVRAGERTLSGGGVKVSVPLQPGEVVFGLLRVQQLVGGPAVFVTGAAPAVVPQTSNDVFWDFPSAPAAISIGRDLRPWEPPAPR